MDDKDLDRLAERVVEKLEARRPAPRLMDMAATAVYMGRSVSAVQHLLKRGKLPVTKIDGKLQIDRVALDKLIVESTSW